MRRAMQRFWLGAVVLGVLIAVLAEPRAQPAPGEDALVLSADESLAEAMRNGDKSSARRLLSLQFTFVDDKGKLYERKDFLADLKGLSTAPASDEKVKIYGLVAMVTGHRNSAQGDDTFFLDIWAKQKGAWRALTMQGVALGAAGAPAGELDLLGSITKPFDCKNPCQTLSYRVRSPVEQDIVNAFQAIEKATVAHDASEWGRHIADEFVYYRSGRAPVAKSGSVVIIEDQKTHDTNELLSAIQSMRLWAYGDGAAMISTDGVPDNTQPLLRIARVWVKRNGQWQLAITVETAIQTP